MKKSKADRRKQATEDMRPEYDFTGMKGVRGKYYRASREGHEVRVTHEDGTVTTQYFTLEDGAVMLEPDVREYFPNSESRNRALRTLMALVPSRTRPSTGRERRLEGRPAGGRKRTKSLR